MTEVENDTSEAAEPAKKEPGSVTRTLVDAKANEMQFIATRKKSGWSSYVVHRILKDGKLEKSTRGATVEHDDLDAAKAEIEKGVKAAAKLGWTERKGGGGGYVARPDAFSLSNLPKPQK